MESEDNKKIQKLMKWKGKRMLDDTVCVVLCLWLLFGWVLFSVELGCGMFRSGSSLIEVGERCREINESYGRRYFCNVLFTSAYILLIYGCIMDLISVVLCGVVAKTEDYVMVVTVNL